MSIFITSNVTSRSFRIDGVADWQPESTSGTFTFVVDGTSYIYNLSLSEIQGPDTLTYSLANFTPNTLTFMPNTPYTLAAALQGSPNGNANYPNAATINYYILTEISGVSFTGFDNIKYNGDSLDTNSKLIINPGSFNTGTYTFTDSNIINSFKTTGISLNFNQFSGFDMGTNLVFDIQLETDDGTPLSNIPFQLDARISLTNITNLKANATFVNCDSLSANGFSVYIGPSNGTDPIATTSYSPVVPYTITNSIEQVEIIWSNFSVSGFNPSIETEYVLWMDSESGLTNGAVSGIPPGVVKTTLSINPSYITAVEDADATGFKVVYDLLYTSSTGDLLEISGGDTGNTFTLIITDSVSSGDIKTYTYASFLDGGSSFSPTSGVEYDLTLKVDAGIAGIGKVKYIAGATPFITVSNVLTPSQVIVTITNYTTVTGDKLVITPLSGSPSYVLPSGTSDTVTLLFGNNFSTIISASVQYTMTLWRNGGTVAGPTDTFELAPADDNPEFEVEIGTVTDVAFTIAFVRLYTPAAGDTLEIKTTGGTTLATYTITADEVEVGFDFARTYEYYTFSPPSFIPTPGTTYNLVLTSVAPGYFAPYTTTLLYSPALAPLDITNVSKNGFTIDYQYKSGDITNNKLIIIANDLPFVTITSNPTQPVPYLFTTFSPSFSPSQNVVYTVNLTDGPSLVMSGTFMISETIPALIITNATLTEFTVNYVNAPGDISGDTLVISTAGLPSLTLSSTPAIPITYQYTEFSPIFSPSQNVLYTVNLKNGATIVMSGTFTISGPPPPVPCFREGTRILCDMSGTETYLPIESLKPGMRVKTLQNGYLPIDMIGYTILKNPGHAERIQNRLYKCSTANYPTLTEDLYITGCHSILVDHLTDAQKQATIDQLERIFITDDKYRLMACIDERATPHADDAEYPIWHIALENTEYYQNYGIWANGLLVETCSKRYLKELSGMTLVV
jgi:hypothetical protein